MVSMNSKIAAHALVAEFLRLSIRDLGYSWIGCTGGEHVIGTRGRMFMVDLNTRKVREVSNHG